MKRFCPGCGAELESGALFCGNCGIKIPEEITADEAGSGRKALNLRIKPAAAVMVALAAVIIILIVIKIAVSYSGSSGFLKKTMKAIKNYDIETLADNTSDVIYEAMNESNIDDDYLYERYEYYVGNNVTDYFETYVGHNYKFSYEIDEIYTATDRQLNKALSGLNDSLTEYAEDKIKKMVIAEVEIEAVQNKKEKSVDATVYMTKEGGSWKLYQIEFDK